MARPSSMCEKRPRFKAQLVEDDAGEQFLRPLSRDLARREQQNEHPRLRWPRVNLERTWSQPTTLSTGSSTSSTTGSSRSPDPTTKPRHDRHERRPAPREQLTRPLRGGKMSRKCKEEPSWQNAFWCPKLPVERLKKDHALRSWQDGDQTNRDGDGELLPEDLPYTLQKARPQEAIVHGAVVTMRLAEFAPGPSPVAGGGRKGGLRVPEKERSLEERRQSSAQHLLLAGAKLEKKSRKEDSDTKWSMSRAMANRAQHAAGRGDDGTAPRQSEKAVCGNVLDVENWSVDDGYMRSMCLAAGPVALQKIRLSGNRLTEKSVRVLLTAGQSLKLLEVLDISSNRLAMAGGCAVAEFIETAQPPLTELDLSDNNIGDQACVKLCDAFKTHCDALSVLKLAKNDIGSSEVGGMALGSFLSWTTSLVTVDLNWNQLSGNGAYALLSGVWKNGVQREGQLSRTNFAWNRLGMRCGPPKKGVEVCTCGICTATTLTVKMLASVLQENKGLFHVDLSYNRICASDCGILADGIRRNHTLLGLHLNGNDAQVDDMGFIVPNPSNITERDPRVEETESLALYARSMPAELNRSLLSSNTDDPGMLQENLFEGVRRGAQCCWICEHWVEQQLMCIPGVSMDWPIDKPITSIFAFFSIDGFRRPTPLKKMEDPLLKPGSPGRTSTISPKMNMRSPVAGRRRSRRLSRPLEEILDDFRGLQSSKEGHRRSSVAKVGRWRGSRMLPPSIEPVQVVFQVNEQVALLEHLPRKRLPEPKMITLSPLPTAEGLQATKQVEVDCVNLLSVGGTVMQEFRRGGPTAVCVVDDPSTRGGMAILPRSFDEGTREVKEQKWCFERSSFSSFQLDTENVVLQMFEHDWSMTKIGAFIKDAQDQQAVYDYLRPRYKQLLAAYHHCAYTGFLKDNEPAGVGMYEFTNMLGETVGFYTHQFSQASVHSIWIGCKNLKGISPAEQRAMISLSKNKLCRWQFLEAVIRVANARFSDAALRAVSRVQKFMEMTDLGREPLRLRESLHKSFINEECCIACRENLELLEAVYDLYQPRFRFRKANNAGLSYGAWLKLMKDAEAEDDGLSPKDFGTAFALGKELRVDEATSFRHMELSYPEFLLGLGALMMMRRDFEAEFHADMLCEFMEVHLVEACESVMEGGGMDKENMDFNRVREVLDLVVQIYEDADENGAGCLDFRELKRALYQKHFLDHLKELGYEMPHPDEFAKFYKKMDPDLQGVALPDLAAFFLKMKEKRQNKFRAKAYLHKVFQDFDNDGNETIDAEEWDHICSDPHVMKKMQALGISPEAMKEGIAQMAKENEGTEEVSMQELVDHFLGMVSDTVGGSRAINFLRQQFYEADADGSGKLDRDEVARSLCTERVAARLAKLDMPVPDWLSLFDEMDTDGDGELDWNELSAGVRLYWNQHFDEQAKAMVQQVFTTADMPVNLAHLAPLMNMEPRSSFFRPRKTSGQSFRSSHTTGSSPRISSVTLATTPPISQRPSRVSHRTSVEDSPVGRKATKGTSSRGERLLSVTVSRTDGNDPPPSSGGAGGSKQPPTIARSSSRVGNEALLGEWTGRPASLPRSSTSAGNVRPTLRRSSSRGDALHVAFGGKTVVEDGSPSLSRTWHGGFGAQLTPAQEPSSSGPSLRPPSILHVSPAKLG